MICFSRVVLGAHSYNQVTLGALWGLFLTCIYECWYYDWMRNRLENLITKSQKNKMVCSLIAIFIFCNFWATLQVALMSKYYTKHAENFVYYSKCEKCKNTPLGGNFQIFYVAPIPMSFVLAYYWYCANKDQSKYIKNYED